MKAMDLKAAVIGAGIISDQHFEAMQRTEGYTPCAVVDINKDKAEQAAKRYGVRAYTDYHEMMETEQPNVAAIALPHFLHKETALYAAERGCHLMLEKPMALTTTECDEIIAAARRGNIRILVGHTQHYMAENLAAKAILNSGELGELVMINDTRHIHYYKDSRPQWFLEKAKSGGGILANLGAHSIDKIQWLTDSYVRRVRASVSHHGKRGDVEGSGIIWLELDNGIPATIVQSGYPGASRNETELIFTGGMLKLNTGQDLWISRGGTYEPVEVTAIATPFELQYRELRDAIREARDPECSGDYGRSVIAAIEQVYRSAETGTEQEVTRPV
ncbi:Gfo/Idh/MocA family protein [Paenibacillus baimaensis]|nr:Gfo/Idh/MocA family oxidoreductase [Paenibacillus sp. WQ 127069]